jgi:hypothetical protein
MCAHHTYILVVFAPMHKMHIQHIEKQREKERSMSINKYYVHIHEIKGGIN